MPAWPARKPVHQPEGSLATTRMASPTAKDSSLGSVVSYSEYATATPSTGSTRSLSALVLAKSDGHCSPGRVFSITTTTHFAPVAG